jgi:hypothetical protein
MLIALYYIICIDVIIKDFCKEEHDGKTARALRTDYYDYTVPDNTGACWACT